MEDTINLLASIVVSEPADLVEDDVKRLRHSLALERAGVQAHLRRTGLLQLADLNAHLETHIVARLKVDIPVGERSLREVSVEGWLSDALHDRSDNLLSLPSADNRATDNLVKRTGARQDLDWIREPELRELDRRGNGRRSLRSGGRILGD